jgi:hypothetical protein
MAMTHSVVARGKIPGFGQVAVIGTAFSGNYATPGEEITAIAIGGKAFLFAFPMQPNLGGHMVNFTRQNSDGKRFTGVKVEFREEESTAAGGPLPEIADAAYPASITDNDPLVWLAVYQ